MEGFAKTVTHTYICITISKVVDKHTRVLQVMHIHTFLVEDGVSATAGEADLLLRGLSTSFFATLVGTRVME